MARTLDEQRARDIELKREKRAALRVQGLTARGTTPKTAEERSQANRKGGMARAWHLNRDRYLGFVADEAVRHGNADYAVGMLLNSMQTEIEARGGSYGEFLDALRKRLRIMTESRKENSTDMPNPTASFPTGGPRISSAKPATPSQEAFASNYPIDHLLNEEAPPRSPALEEIVVRMLARRGLSQP